MENREGIVKGEGRRASEWASLLAWGLILGPVALGIHGLAPREPASDVHGEFSLARAKHDLAFVAREPRPRGSDHHARVREYLVEQLEDAGLNVELQYGQVGDTDLVNVIATLPGQDSSGAILLMAHYDSVPPSPGAGDDGAGTVSVLETMRQLATSAPRNDVIALFSDGEELGLLGAKLFARAHPLYAKVDLVLNYEAIGNGGPCVMFETGPGSGGLVQLWAESVPHPFGNSLTAVIYGWMPNDTDLSVLRDDGRRGLNFAIGGGSGAYHSPHDTPERLEDRSLFHMGAGALRLTRKLADLDLAQLEREPVAYFSLPFGSVVTWSSRVHVWIAIAALALTGFVAGRRRSVSLFDWAVGLFATLLLWLASSLFAWRFWNVGSGSEFPASYDQVHTALAWAVFGGVLGSLFSIHYWTRGEHGARRARGMALGALTLWAGIFAFFLDAESEHIGASYPFAAAVVCGGLALIVSCTCGPFWRRLGSALLLLPAALVLAPFLSFLVQLASQDWRVAGRMAALLVGLGMTLCVPLLVAGRVHEDTPSRPQGS